MSACVSKISRSLQLLAMIKYKGGGDVAIRTIQIRDGLSDGGRINPGRRVVSFHRKP